MAEMPVERRTRSPAASPALAVSSNAKSPTCPRHRHGLSVCLFYSLSFPSQRVPLGVVEEPSILHFALCLERSEPIFDLFAILFFNSILRLTFLHFLMSKLFLFSLLLSRAAWAAVIEHGPSLVHVSRLILQFFVYTLFISSHHFANFCSSFFFMAPSFHFSSWSYLLGMIP